MVEVPSHTLEHYSADPRVLALFARHRSTGEPLPPGLLEGVQASRRRFVGLDQQQQVGGLGSELSCLAAECRSRMPRQRCSSRGFTHPVLPPLPRTSSPVQLQYCLIDQLLHGPQPPMGAAAERAVADIMREHSALGHAPGTHPHIR